MSNKESVSTCKDYIKCKKNQENGRKSDEKRKLDPSKVAITIYPPRPSVGKILNGLL